MNILLLYKKAFSNIDRNVWLLSLAMFVNRCGSMVLLFTTLFLTNELHWSKTAAGITMSFYGIGSIAGSFVGGWLSDRRNYYYVMVGSLISSGLILPFILITEDFYAITALIFLYAFSADMFRPALSKGIAFYTSPENRSRSVSLVRLAINLGFAIGPVVGGFLAVQVGYKVLFLLDGVTSILAAMVLIAFLPRKSMNQSKSDYKPIGATRSAYHDPAYLVFILLVAVYGICFFQLFASVPKYLDEVWHYKPDDIGRAMFLNGAIVVLCEMPLMTLLERHKKYFRFIPVGVWCIPISFLFLVYGFGLPVMIFMYIVFITFSEILAMPFMTNFSLSRPEKERQGEYSALYSIAYGISNILAPIAGLGLASSIGFENMFLFMVLLSITCAIGFFSLYKYLDKAGEFDKTDGSPNPSLVRNDEQIDAPPTSNAEEII